MIVLTMPAKKPARAAWPIAYSRCETKCLGHRAELVSLYDSSRGVVLRHTVGAVDAVGRWNSKLKLERKLPWTEAIALGEELLPNVEWRAHERNGR